MFLQKREISLLDFVYLVLLIISTGNFTVRPAVQQYEPKTLENSCPSIDKLQRVKSEVLHDIEQHLVALKYTCNGTLGWKQVVFINMTDTSYDCPPGLNLTSYSKRTCGRAHTNSRDCSSTIFSVGGSEYSRVCGRIRGYQVGSTSAFWGYRFSPKLEGQYVDGVSLTHGPVGECQHIWSFTAGLSEEGNQLPRGYVLQELCPCDTINPGTVSPPFVGNDYFCESGLHSTWSASYNGVPFLDDPLWDGENCISTSTCCQLHNPPWFTKTLPNSTTDDIELRLCFTATSDRDDTALELIELYIQ